MSANLFKYYNQANDDLNTIKKNIRSAMSILENLSGLGQEKCCQALDESIQELESIDNEIVALSMHTKITLK